jgi:hypothetical protein
MMVSRCDFEFKGEMKERIDFGDDVATVWNGQGPCLFKLHQHKRSDWIGLTGGQKSFCMSTTRSADVSGSKFAMIGGRAVRTRERYGYGPAQRYLTCRNGKPLRF